MTEHDFEVMRICVKAYLHHMRHIDDDIREIKLRIEQVKDRMKVCGIDYSKITVTTSTEGDTIGASIALLQELKSEFDDRIIHYQKLYEDAKDLCQPHFVGRYAIWMHEVERREWEYVGRVIGYEERQARRIADGGIRELYELMPEEYRRYSIPNAQPK